MFISSKPREIVEMRKIYAGTMIELAKEDNRIVVLDSDLLSPIGMKPFQEKYPNRTFDCGIMEANMAGVAAGLSAAGCIPFTHTFACFQSRKCIDQIFLTAGFADLNVKYIGSDPGILALYNGASHMSLEDMGILRNVPNMTLLEPCDAYALRALLRQIKNCYGLHYIRMNRKSAPTVYNDTSSFELGKGNILRDGDDVTIISSGIMVCEALDAADILASENISARVIDMFTWKPLDEKLVLESASKTNAIVTAENHRVSTGLGVSVAALLSLEYPTALEMVGVNDVYGEVGTQDYLMQLYHLNANDIVIAARKAIARKKM